MQDPEYLYLGIIHAKSAAPSRHPILTWFDSVIGFTHCIEEVGYTYVGEAPDKPGYYAKTDLLRIYRIQAVSSEIQTLARLTWPDRFQFRMAANIYTLTT